MKADQSVAKLSRYYGLKVKSISAYPSYYLRTAAYRVKTDRGDIMVKAFRGSERQRQNVDRLTRSLLQKGYPHMPKWCITKAGKRWVRFKDTWFYATEWIQGRQLSASAQGLFHLGSALAKLHQLPVHSERSNRPESQVLYAKLQHEEDKFHRGLTHVQSEDSVLGAWFRAHGPECLALSAEAWQVLRSPEATACLHEECAHPILVHGDVTRPNTIEHAGGVCLIDWEQVHLGSALYELARALNNTTDFVLPHITAILDGYQSVRSLSDAERKTVSGLFTFPREAWYMVSQWHKGKTTGNLDVLSRLWDERLTAANWMQRWAAGTSN